MCQQAADRNPWTGYTEWAANWQLQIEHVMWGCRAAWSPLWWWPCTYTVAVVDLSEVIGLAAGWITSFDFHFVTKSTKLEIKVEKFKRMCPSEPPKSGVFSRGMFSIKPCRGCADPFCFHYISNSNRRSQNHYSNFRPVIRKIIKSNEGNSMKIYLSLCDQIWKTIFELYFFHPGKK